LSLTKFIPVLNVRLLQKLDLGFGAERKQRNGDSLSFVQFWVSEVREKTGEGPEREKLDSGLES